jgi:PAS domain S-box-containing protein
MAHTPFIMVTDTESEQFYTDIIKLGADDYVLKDRLIRLPVAIEAALKQQETEKEKMAAIEKLNLNEENYRNLVERISDGFMALDLNWRFTYVNKQTEQFFKRPPGDLIGKNIWTEFPETIYGPFYKAYHKAMRTQENSCLKEYSVMLERWVEANIYPSLSGISIYFRDITEQKKAEEEIKLSHERFLAVSKATSDAIWDYDFATGKTFIAGEGYKYLFGYDIVNQYSEEFFWENRLHPDDKERILTELENVISDPDKTQSASEYRFLKADGSYAYIYDRFFIIRENGKPIRMLGSKQDITERKKAEEETRRSVERFQTLSKATNDAVWDWDLVTDEVWWSESFYNLLEFDPNLPVPDLYEWTKKIHPDDRDELVERLKKVRKSNANPWQNEFRFQLADGSYATVLDRAYLLRDDSGKPVRMIGALVDITQHKRLVKEMEVLSMIAKETGNGVLIFDRETRQTLWINEGFTRLTGYTQKDIYGKEPALLLWGAETDPHTIEYIKTQIAGNLVYSADILIYTKEGKKKWHYISGQPMQDENGQITKYFVLATDISDRLRTEQERLTNKIKQQKEITRVILQAQEAERNELGRELHDNINQILSAISMKLDYCLDNYQTSKAIIAECRQHIQDAIKETRDLSHRMVMPHFSERSLKKILRSLLANYSAIQTVELDTDRLEEKDISPAVKETLFRIVQEQLNNIQKHAKADKVRILLSSDAAKIVMLIEDNGVGFDTQKKRNGIGIANIMTRVESYNGTVDIISQPGKGCTLSANIPLIGLN